MSVGGNVLSRPLRAWREARATFGALDGFLYLIDRVLGRISPRFGLHAYDLMAQPIRAEPTLPVSRRRNLTAREIREGDAELDAMPAPRAVRAARFAQQARCIGAYVKGKLVGYLWYCARRYDEDEVRCSYVLPDARSVFDFDLYVFPEHRMGTAFAALWDVANEHFTRDGIAWTYSRVSRFNPASKRAHAHFDWQAVGRATFVRAGSIQLMLSTLAPFLALTWSGRPLLRLPAIANDD